MYVQIIDIERTHESVFKRGKGIKNAAARISISGEIIHFLLSCIPVAELPLLYPLRRPGVEEAKDAVLLSRHFNMRKSFLERVRKKPPHLACRGPCPYHRATVKEPPASPVYPPFAVEPGTSIPVAAHGIKRAG